MCSISRLKLCWNLEEHTTTKINSITHSCKWGNCLACVCHGLTVIYNVLCGPWCASNRCCRPRELDSVKLLCVKTLSAESFRLHFTQLQNFSFGVWHHLPFLFPDLVEDIEARQKILEIIGELSDKKPRKRLEVTDPSNNMARRTSSARRLDIHFSRRL